MRDLIGFYHLATMGHYKEVNAEELGIIKMCGLLRDLKVLNIGVVGSDPIDLLYEHKKFNIQHLKKVVDSPDAFEYPTMKWIQDYCKNNECYVLYSANVGVSHAKNRVDYYPGWRDLCMEYYIMRYKECIKALDEGYDIVGIEWQIDPCPHFSGSFYWARSEYINTLPSLEDAQKFGLKMVGTHRHGTEFWIGMNPNVKYKTLFQTGYSWRSRPVIDWYEEAMKREGKVHK